MGDGKKEVTTPNDLANIIIATDVAKDALNKFLQDSQPATYNSTIQQTAKGMNVDTTSNRGPGSRMEIHTRPEETGYNNGLINETYRTGFDIYKETPGKDGKPVRTAERANAELTSSLWDLDWHGTDTRLNFNFTGRDGKNPITMSRANQIDWKDASGKVGRDANGFPIQDIQSTSGANCFMPRPDIKGDRSCAFRVDGLKDGQGRPLNLNMSMELNPYPNGTGFRERIVVRQNETRNVIGILESNVNTDRNGKATQIETTVRPPRKPQ